MALRLPDFLDAADAELEIGFSNLERRLLATYANSYRSVSAELDALRRAIAAAPEVATITGSGALARGISPSWLLQQDRYISLQGELRSLVVELGNTTGTLVEKEIRRAYELGLQSAETLATAGQDPRLSTSSFAHVPDDAIRRFVASSSTDPDRMAGSPIARLLSTFRNEAGEEVSGYARDVLVNGLARGRALRSVAAELEQGIRGMTLSRALTIARTETLRAHREAHFQSYKRNPEIVESWVWRAAVGNADPPPCAACFSQHGTEHPLDERMETHPNCRCRMIPKRKPFRGVEPTGAATRIIPGEYAFRSLPDGLQRRILGPARYRAYRAGDLSFDDLKGYTTNEWGRTLRVTPLRDLGFDRFGRKLGPGSTPPPAPAAKMPREKLDAKVRGIEDEIVLNERFETAVLFDDETGAILIDKRGAQYEVGFTKDELALMRGRTLTHNHPRAYASPLSDGSLNGGSSFSENDVFLAGQQRLARIRAVSPGWRHELEWADTWTGSATEIRQLKTALGKADSEVRQRLMLELNATTNRATRRRLDAAKAMPDKGTVPDAEWQTAYDEYVSITKAVDAEIKDATINTEFLHNHSVWELVAQRTGFFRYSREPRQ